MKDKALGLLLAVITFAVVHHIKWLYNLLMGAWQRVVEFDPGEFTLYDYLESVGMDFS